jgi:hypothetical protein
MGEHDDDARQFERERWEREMAFREREVSIKEGDLSLREGELALKRREQASAGWRSPLIVAIMAATIAGVANALVAIVNGRLQRQLEDGRAEQTRVLEMIKTGDADKAAGNLQFLLDAGLIADPERTARIREFLKGRSPGSGPALPGQITGDPYLGGIVGRDDATSIAGLQSADPIRKASTSVGQIRGIAARVGATSCTAFLVTRDIAVTARHCVSGLQSAQLFLRDGIKETGHNVALPPMEVSGMDDEGSYALIKVAGNPGDTYGTLRLSAVPPQVGQMLGIVLFRMASNPLAVFRTPDCSVRLLEGSVFYHLCDTGPGSAGAPVFSQDGTVVVGVHYSRRSEKGGVATRADVLRRTSKVLQEIR